MTQLGSGGLGKSRAERDHSAPLRPEPPAIADEARTRLVRTLLSAVRWASITAKRMGRIGSVVIGPKRRQR